MDVLIELERLVDALAREGIDYALCGGIAVNIYGHVRATRDIDMLVERASVERVRELAAGHGFALRSGRIPFGVGTPEEREVWRVSKSEQDELLSLDLLVVAPVFQGVWESKETVEWRGRKLGIVSARGLARMKRLAGRAQDIADLEALGLEEEPS